MRVRTRPHTNPHPDRTNVPPFPKSDTEEVGLTINVSYHLSARVYADGKQAVTSLVLNNSRGKNRLPIHLQEEAANNEANLCTVINT